MADNQTYFKAILPLRLEWEPCYSTTEKLRIGQRVKVQLAHKEYTGVVSEFNVNPEIALNRVQPMIATEDSLGDISEQELKLWRFVSDYYLCTIGEVYKAAYPSGLLAVEAKKARAKKTDKPASEVRHRPPLSERRKDLVRKILKEVEDKRITVVQATDREVIYASLLYRILEDGGTALVLCPRVADAKSMADYLEQRFPGKVVECSTAETLVARRELSKRLRSGESLIVVGTRQTVFLPFSRLDAVIVDEEQDSSYKQDSPTPRYNARDIASMLAKIFDSRMILGTFSPSLETLYNISCGKFALVQEENTTPLRATIIETDTERRKNGMDGSFSKILTMNVREAVKRKDKVLMLLPFKDSSDIEIEWRERFPDLKIKITTLSKARDLDLRKYSIVAVLCAEYMGGSDFRSDEKARRELLSLENRCNQGSLYIQLRDRSWRALSDASSLMEERREFQYPPYSRMIELKIADTNEKRRALMVSLLSGRLQSLLGEKTVVEPRECSIFIFLPKDRELSSRKNAVKNIIDSFEAERRYNGHITIDVDPL